MAGLDPVRGDESGTDISVRVSVTVGDLYMVLAWADEGMRLAGRIDDGGRLRAILGRVRQDMNAACDAANRQAGPAEEPPSPDPRGTCVIHGDYWTDDCQWCRMGAR